MLVILLCSAYRQENRVTEKEVFCVRPMANKSQSLKWVQNPLSEMDLNSMMYVMHWLFEKLNDASYHLQSM